MRTVFVRDGLQVIDSLLASDPNRGGTRMDAGESAFFERQLESIEQRLYEKKFRELKYRRLIPTSHEIPAGTEVITYYLWTKVGMAKIIANPTDDPPMADAFATRHTANVRTLGSGFRFSTQELRKAQVANVPLEARKADATRRAVREKENDIAWNGDAAHGLMGLLTNPNIPAEEVAQAAGGGFSRAWGVDKTPTEVLADISGLQANIRTDTKDVHSGDTLLLPIPQFNYLAQTPISATIPQMTLMQWILDHQQALGIRTIEAVPELAGSGPGGTDQMLLYELDPEVLSNFIPMEMVTLPPERRNYSFIVDAEAENGGTVVRYPLACRFGYGI